MCDNGSYAISVNLISSRIVSSLGHDLFQLDYVHPIFMQSIGKFIPTSGPIRLEYTSSLSRESEEVEFRVFDSEDLPLYDVVFSPYFFKSDHVSETVPTLSSSDAGTRSTLRPGHLRHRPDSTGHDTTRHVNGYGRRVPGELSRE